VEKNVISMSTLGNQPNGSRASGLVRRAIIASAIILVTLLVEAFLITRMGVNLPDFWTIIAAGLALEIIPVLVWVVRPDFITRILGRRVPKDQMAPIHIEVKLPETVPVASNAEKLRADFEAGIHRKGIYHYGQEIQFWAKYTGKLKNGGFSAKVTAPDGVILPNGKSVDWWADENAKKALNGNRLHSRTWEHPIPANCAGRFKVGIVVYDNSSAEQTVLDTIDEFFVVESGAHPTQQPDDVKLHAQQVSETVPAEMPILWYNAGKILPREYGYGPHDIEGADSKSKLTVIQFDNKARLKGVMDGLHKKKQYYVRIYGPYHHGAKTLPEKRFSEKLDRLYFITDENGRWSWSLELSAKNSPTGTSAISVLVNEVYAEAPYTILISDNFQVTIA